MIVYIETSAFLKLVKEEAESPALRDRFVALRRGSHRVVSSALLATEAHRAVHRITALDHVNVARALRQVELIDIDGETLRAAGMMPGPHLRTLDAIHVAAATQVNADEMLTYDHRVVAAATAAGLPTEYPGGAH